MYSLFTFYRSLDLCYLFIHLFMYLFVYYFLYLREFLSRSIMQLSIFYHKEFSLKTFFGSCVKMFFKSNIK